MSQVHEEQIRLGALDTVARPRKLTGVLRSAAKQTNLLPVFLVLTAMMVALWLMGMPFMQALTISTALKISMVLFAARRLPRTSKG
ncbi:hypothetical protein [Streptomyces sp. BK340]|uniref:hypothetical protein n=1 Tax=Streptomyces sp. BK340 TaxID=2572903 RepID=UPI0011A653A4|nr:hypothetical protein [Streptomyces sp. BK340]TVZ80712.1 hypothetical protein FB157_12886 [Streptomyces sp. BK340]